VLMNLALIVMIAPGLLLHELLHCLGNAWRGFAGK
jgi:hypothetical protein